MDDAEIIALYWKRDETAIEETSQVYGAYCHSIAEHILHSDRDAEECVNDTWMRAWNAMPPQKPNRLRLFLGKITRNLAFDRYRQQRAEKRGSGEMDAVLEELAECIADPEDVETVCDQRALRESFNDFLRKLPQRERQLFLRRYFYAEPVRSIAEAYGLRSNHTSVILRRTRQKLREHLKKEGFI